MPNCQSKPTYIRAKREKTTLFLCTEPKDSLEQVKTKLCQALDNKKTSDEVRLLVDGKTKGEYSVLEDTKTLENNAIVYFVYYDRNDGQWENVNVIEPELLDDDLMEEEEVPAASTTKKEKGKGRA
ncbi:hypothetical protein MAM1_0031d02404 [Mucor ambiguus]|uniref:Ubiquitin-like domain-containing protein n=1 Tax=Mucor ambiguus TaxID=91626 RepID=A0A0C9M7H8_9FUNG|nr:hypothetical protein MAM1_0031d02404 [Mucor ambiguus]